MPRRLPPLNALRAFEAAGRLGSFKAAAAELHVTHGAISRHVQSLEAWLGTPLFERSSRRVTLTEAGSSYLVEAGPALDRIAAATERCKDRRGRRLLRVNALSTFTLRWLLPNLDTFQSLHPGMEVRLTTANDAVDAVPEPQDVIIRGGPDTFSGYITRPFLAEQRFPVCSPGLFARSPLNRPEDLEQHVLLHVATLPRNWSKWLALAGVPDLEPAGAFVLDHIYLALEAALDGLGVAMGPTALVAADLAAGRLVAPFAELKIDARTYCAYVPEEQSTDPVIDVFCRWLEETGSLSLPSSNQGKPPHASTLRHRPRR